MSAFCAAEIHNNKYNCYTYVVPRCGRLAPRQPLSVCALLPALREEQASTASWEPRPPFEAAEMD